MSIFEELIEVALLQKFSLVEIITFYSTFFDNTKEYADLNDAVCQTVETFLNLDKLKDNLT